MLGLLKDKEKVEAVGYKLMDVNLLKEVIAKSFICKYCKHAKGTINILKHMGGRKGVAECIIFICSYCIKETVIYTSKKVKGGSSTFDVNIRSTCASLPFGREGLVKFCSVMDLPPSVLQQSYQKITEKLASESKQLAETSMKESAQRLINVMMEKNPENIDIQVDDTMLANVAVSIDGAWQKRGHSSKHGVVFLISVETDDMLDFCVKTIHCHERTLHKKDDINSEKHIQWYRNHASNCSINYEGSSGAMECQAGVDMFLRSITTRNLRYVVFVGDGDSACYGKVSNACADMYGDSYSVTKEECVGHIQ